MVSRLNFGRWSCSFAFPHPSSVLEVLNHEDSISRANDWHTEHLMDRLHLQPSLMTWQAHGCWVPSELLCFKKSCVLIARFSQGFSVYVKSSTSAI